MAAGPLGRLQPTTDEHIRKWSMVPEAMPTTATPVVVGWDWFPEFDEPIRDRAGFWRVRSISPRSRPRGGHCVCLKPYDLTDPWSWYLFYDQVAEGKCVGEGWSRAKSLKERKRFDPTWLWNEAKKIDEWLDTNPGDNEGTSVRAAGDVLRTVGHCEIRRGETCDPDPNFGIEHNHWATSVEEMVACMHSPRYLQLGRLPFLNSWGFHGYPSGDVWNVAGYPHITWVDLETVRFLTFERWGDATVFTDR